MNEPDILTQNIPVRYPLIIDQKIVLKSKNRIESRQTGTVNSENLIMADQKHTLRYIKLNCSCSPECARLFYQAASSSSFSSASVLSAERCE